MDAGCEFNVHGEARFWDYIRMLEYNQIHFRFPMVTFYVQGDVSANSLWTKADVPDKLASYIARRFPPAEAEGIARGIRSGMSLPQDISTFVMVQNTEEAHLLLNLWKGMMESDYHLIDDTPSTTPSSGQSLGARSRGFACGPGCSVLCRR